MTLTVLNVLRAAAAPVTPTARVTTQFPRLATDYSLCDKVLHIGHCLPARNQTTFPRLSSPRRHNFSYTSHKVIHEMEDQLHSFLTPALEEVSGHTHAPAALLR